MNVFCHPGLFRDGRLCLLLDVQSSVTPTFRFRAHVPLANGRFDRTEVDMRLGDLLIEAKLTESVFQKAPKTVVRAYRDFREVSDEENLPQTERDFLSYQLIRNVLAAHASGCTFCMLTDARRPDLIEGWYAVMKCVHPVDLRLRCKMLTWQELARVLPRSLREFLSQEYGINVPSLEGHTEDCIPYP
jgi:hypothetical protein